MAKAQIRAAAETFRPNPALDVERVIQELKVGEALVSVLHGGGEPSMVQRTLIRPPSGRLGPATPQERKARIEASPLYGRYEETVDRESAYEMLTKRTKAAAETADSGGGWGSIIMGDGTSKRQGYGETFTKSIMRSVASSIGTAIVRAVLGGRRR